MVPLANSLPSSAQKYLIAESQEVSLSSQTKQQTQIEKKSDYVHKMTPWLYKGSLLSEVAWTVSAIGLFFLSQPRQSVETVLFTGSEVFNGISLIIGTHNYRQWKRRTHPTTCGIIHPINSQDAPEYGQQSRVCQISNIATKTISIVCSSLSIATSSKELMKESVLLASPNLAIQLASATLQLILEKCRCCSCNK